MSLLPGMPEVKLPSNILGIPVSGLYGADALEENATNKAIAERLARGRFEDPKSDKKDPVTGERKANFAEQLTEMFGGPKFSDVSAQATALGKNREATQSIQKYKDDYGLDFTGLSAEDRKDPEKVRVFATKEIARRGFADKGVTATGDTLAEINRSGKVGEQKLKDEVLEGSLSWQTSRSDRDQDIARDTAISDRNFGLQLQTLTNQNNQALASLKAQIEQAKMTNEQSVLDREYLDRRDQRDYDYRIKKDDQESMDKIFALLIGGIDKIF